MGYSCPIFAYVLFSGPILGDSGFRGFRGFRGSGVQGSRVSGFSLGFRVQGFGVYFQHLREPNRTTSLQVPRVSTVP